MLNMRRTQRELIEQMQGFGQLVTINCSEKDREKLYVGATKTINVTSDKDRPGDAKFINPGAPLEALMKSESKLLQETALEWGLNAADFLAVEGRPASDSASGKAKRIDNERLLKRTRTAEGYLRPDFITLIKHTLLIVKYWDANGLKLPGVDASIVPDSMDELEVELTFAQEPSIQTNDDFLLFQNRARVGLDCYADEYRMEHPEAGSRAEAETLMQEAIQSNDRVMQASIMRQVATQMALAAGGEPGQPPGAPAVPPKPGEPAPPVKPPDPGAAPAAPQKPPPATPAAK